ncbi:MAG: hypothetical protein A3J55_01345 [Candidatus Ryanbacteria bacterium RIFCSPHIGHO2_02_FULL_45_17b]|uniref:Thioredoxin domain-containing protein n=1 Tax=Candidatus Ryanbacteria bacterium RIFCSPHIGHO2_01_FULL_45_22 TaxID=1802114 RepID=A0A1G2G1T3_9BACT|nr:MAG: hypothetical protein A2719_03815 [Candidatus Ryanbacteria bacterium RIFCSPHIGHO2_01_FULL_45_22]OGZ47179.1 MAG: hypothetical protein A3J55_01345 [Candidatus Ryanbacteria bacterium RIFCSPHIGHO2_02_FULL_45_17b]
MNSAKQYILIVVVIILGGAIYFINSTSVQRGGSDETVTVAPRVPSASNSTTASPPTEAAKDTTSRTFLSAEAKSKRYELAKEITTPDGFINTPSTSSGQATPITIGELVGKKVVLIDFWTYSCINCQRTTPYLNTWYEKYKDKGLVIIGVHTPEFEFEKDYTNVKTAVEKFGIKFPVVLDNDYSTWTAYKNQYWPRKYLIDIDGYVVYNHIGEGGYEETEKKIQEALSERMAVLGEDGTITQSLTKDTSAQNEAKSPETYFGSARNNQQASLLFPRDSWNIQPEFAENNSTGASIVYTYTAKDVFFVAKADTETIVEVLRDGNPLGSEAGSDIVKTPDGKTVLKIKEARLYKIIEGEKSETHKLELKIQKPGLKAFTFTFG